jgi:PAS domain S-box-containing protein
MRTEGAHRGAVTKMRTELLEKSKEEIRESMWIEVIKNIEHMYAELASIHAEIERKDHELKTSKSFTDNIIKSMRNVLVVTDERGNLKMANDAAARLFGYSMNELIGRKIEMLFVNKEAFKRIITRISRSARSKRGTLDLESVFVTKTGAKIPMAICCSTLTDEEGNAVGTVIVAQDLRRIKNLVIKAAKAADAYRLKALELQKAYNELKGLQKHLIQTEKLTYLGKLAAGIAHEINNPMTGVLAMTSFLLKKLPAGSPLCEDLNLVVEETKRCKKIVEDLLEFSRQKEPEKTLCNLNTIIEESLAIIEKQPFFHNIEISRQLDDSLPAVMVDKNQIKQVFVNLILNAHDAMPEGGSLKVETAFRDGENMIEIRFADTGCGINQEDIPRLFDPFFTTKEKAKGTGLGLSVSHEIISRHGGAINVESRPNAGSTFVVRLPVENK